MKWGICSNDLGFATFQNGTVNFGGRGKLMSKTKAVQLSIQPEVVNHVSIVYVKDIIRLTLLAAVTTEGS